MGARTSATLLGYMADAYTGVAVTARTDYGYLASTVGSGAAMGTELTGGSPAYARVALAPSGSGASRTFSPTFNVASGSTVAEFGKATAATGGTYLDAVAVSSQPFSSQGTYQANGTLGTS